MTTSAPVFRCRAGPGHVCVGLNPPTWDEAVSPALTTMDVDRAEMGRLAVKRLLVIQNKPLTKERYKKNSMFPKLIIRESCGGK